MNDAPRYIKVNPSDNVAIVVSACGLPPGTTFPDGLVLLGREKDIQRISGLVT